MSDRNLQVRRRGRRLRDGGPAQRRNGSPSVPVSCSLEAGEYLCGFGFSSQFWCPDGGLRAVNSWIYHWDSHRAYGHDSNISRMAETSLVEKV